MRPFEGATHHVALMRTPRLIVKYEPYGENPMPGLDWAGVFLADKAVADAVQAGTVVTFDGAAEQAKFCDFPNEMSRKLVLLEGFLHERNDAVVDEPADGFLDHDLVFAEVT